MLMSARQAETAGPRRDSVPLDVPDGGQTVIWLLGEHDIATVAVLDDTLTAAIGADDADVVVDMRRVSFIDASSIDALLRSREALARRCRRLTLPFPSSCVMHVLTVCGLTDLFEVESSLG